MNTQVVSALKKKQGMALRLVAVIGIWIFGYLIFPILLPKFGEAAGAIFGIAMFVTGWFLGVFRCFWGVLVMLAFLVLRRPEDQLLLPYITQFIPGMLVATITGLTAGWVKKLYDESKNRAIELAVEKKALVEQNALRRQAEEALQKLNAELEIRVLNRTVALETANARLVEAMEERRVVLEHLNTSEERLRQLSETIDDVIWLVDTQRDAILYISPACEQIFEVAQAELVSEPRFWLSGIHPEDRERINTMLSDQLCKQAPFDLEYRILPGAGSTKWVWTRAFPIKDDQGTICRMAGITKDITARKLAQEQVQNSLREKEVLLKEIHHRVKNNLQVISSLLNLAASHVTEPESRQVLKESQNRIHSMALIHEKLYRSEDLARINFKEYIENFSRYLFNSYQRGNTDIVLKLDVQEIYLNIDTAIPCGLVLSELVTNALKYAFPAGESGELTISFYQKSQHECCLGVVDTGIGLAFDRHNLPTNSLGLVLVNSLVEQLDGVLEIDGQHGARFMISFPISRAHS